MADEAKVGEAQVGTAEVAEDTGFDGGAYCPTVTGTDAVNGNEILTCVFTADGSKLLAIDGEQEAKLSLEADTTSVSTKDSKGGWQVQHPTTRNWSIDLDVCQVKDAESQRELKRAFVEGTQLCMKQVYDDGEFTPYCGGSCFVTKYEEDAPSDDVMTVSVTLTGNGKLTYFELDPDAAAKATATPANRTA